MAKNTPVYSIGQVAKLTGLTARQIRYYEQAGLFRAQRSLSNRRLYSTEHVEQLKSIKEMIDKGWTIAGIKNYFAAQRQGSQYLQEQGPLFPREPLSSLYPVDNQAQLLQALQRLEKD
ncbi:MAG: MerR family transcriptional regulator [Limnochordia bacterium]|jgi:DNA-binding transcriptional MerR regulator